MSEDVLCVSWFERDPGGGTIHIPPINRESETSEGSVSDDDR